MKLKNFVKLEAYFGKDWLWMPYPTYFRYDATKNEEITIYLGFLRLNWRTK